MVLSREYEVVEIIKKTSAKVLNNTKVGDIVRIYIDFDKVSSHRPIVYIKNLTNGEEDAKYISVMAKCLNNFKFVETNIQDNMR